MLKKKSERFECIECGCEEYDIEELETRVKDENGNLIGRYPTYVATCKRCGQPMFMDYIDRENKKLEAAFLREHFNLLSVEEIRKLPRRYNISRKDFMTVLSLGTCHQIDENTWEVFDIWAGDAPNDEEEQKLKKVKRDPKYFIELLKEAKDKLEDEVYNRALETAQKLIK